MLTPSLTHYDKIFCQSALAYYGPKSNIMLATDHHHRRVQCFGVQRFPVREHTRCGSPTCHRRAAESPTWTRTNGLSFAFLTIFLFFFTFRKENFKKILSRIIQIYY
jgi:hypothetical protein